MEELIKRYIKLRDAKAQIAEEAKAKAAKITTVMDKIEGFIMEAFSADGIDSAKTEFGTAYKSTQTSATVADWPATLGFIQTQGAWDLLDKRVNKTAVQEYIAEHNDLPPGVNWREETVINVRRSA